MSEFTEDQMNEAIAKNKIVKDSYERIKDVCQSLQNGTDCPDEDIDNFLRFLVGKWK